MSKLGDMRTARRLRDEGHPASRILLVGELNPFGGPDSNALVPWPERCAGHRLQRNILGIDEETYLAMHRRNLCRATWSIKTARFEADVCMQPEWPWTAIVMLGRKVADAFNFGSPFAPPFFEHARRPRGEGGALGEPRPVELISLPHPSGRNTIWNHQENIARARDLLRTLLPGVPWGSLVP